MPRKKPDAHEVDLDLTAKRAAAPPAARNDFDPDDVEMTAERVRLDAGDSIEMTVQRPKLDRDTVAHERPTPVPFADGSDDDSDDDEAAPPLPAPPRRRLDVRLPEPPKRGERRVAGSIDDIEGLDDDDDRAAPVAPVATPAAVARPPLGRPRATAPADPSHRPTRQTPVPRASASVDAVVRSPHDAAVRSPRDAALRSPHDAVLRSPHDAALRSPHDAVLRSPHDAATFAGAQLRPPPSYADALESPWSGDDDVDARRSSKPFTSAERPSAPSPRTPPPEPRPSSRTPQPEPRASGATPPGRTPQPELRSASQRFAATPPRTPSDRREGFDPRAPVRGLQMPVVPQHPSDSGDFRFEEPVAPEVAPTQIDAPQAEVEWDLPAEPGAGDTFEMEVASFSDVEPTGIAGGPPVEMEDRPITNLDPGERGLLAAIAAGSDASRTKYADWLARHGEAARAEYMRAELELAAAPHGDPRRRAAMQRLAAVAPRISMDWRSLVARAPIEGCGAAGRCPGVWNALPATDGDDHRVCATCTHPVYYCASLQLAQLRSRRGEYVAVDLLVERYPNDLGAPSMQCLHCNTPVPSEARFCPNCGQSVQQVVQMGGY
ncbi:MAG: TIGR02996 domain-containing protein [Deltaproteobacteria bacterium]|nr:TIGR02996 domain-containing protein [Deltaproteobacteria bacterium]